MGSYLKTIMDTYPKFSASEKIFADFVVKEPSELTQMSIHEVSKQLGVSASTIINAIKKTGLDGYTDLKLELARESYNPVRQKSWDDLITTEDGDLKNIYHQVTQTNIRALTESLNIVNFDDILSAAQMIIDAPRICFFGTGSSSLLAAEAHDVLFRLGLNCCYNQERDHQLMTAACMREDEVAVVVTQTGVNVDNLKITSLLMERNVRIVGISNYSGTPFARMVNILLAPLGNSEHDFNSNFTFRIPIFCIIEALYYTLINLMGDTAVQTAKKIREIAQDATL